MTLDPNISQLIGGQQIKEVDAGKPAKSPKADTARELARDVLASGAVDVATLEALAKVVGFKGPNAAEDYLYYIFKRSEAQIGKTKSPEDKMTFGRKVAIGVTAFYQSGGDFVELLREFGGRTDSSGNPLPPFTLVFSSGENGTSIGAMAGFEIITESGEVVNMSLAEVRDLEAKIDEGSGEPKPDAVFTQKESKIMKFFQGSKKGLKAAKILKDFMKAFKTAGSKVGFQPSAVGNMLGKNGKEAEGQGALHYGASGLGYLGVQSDIYGECMKIISDGLAKMRQTMSDYVQYEIRETERMMQETAKKLEEAKKQEKKEEVAKLEKKMEKLIEKKKKLEKIQMKIENLIRQVGKAGNVDEATLMTFKGELEGIKEDLKEYVEWANKNEILSKEDLSKFTALIRDIDNKYKTIELSLKNLNKVKELGGKEPQ